MRRAWARVFAAVVVCGAVLHGAAPVGAARGFASPAFDYEWRAGERLAPNFWGPLANATDGVVEEYKDGSLDYSEGGPGPNPGAGTRLVQYFDKGRMEITAPARGDVTNGLLTVELMTGRLQLGNATFAQRAPARVPAVGDPNNTFPTYADLGRLAAPQAVDSIGRTRVTTRLTPDLRQENTNLGASDPLTVETAADLNRFRVPRAFVDYRSRVGLGTVGYAVTRPAWVSAIVGGQPRDVLVQGFERRVLTYTPDNPAAYRVEFGNIGRHYLAWRYPNGVVSAGANTSPYARFANEWDAHGFAMTVQPDGTAVASWRTYATCGEDPPPCDTFTRDEIINGGNAAITFTQTNGDIAFGTVTRSTAPGLLPRGPVQFALQPHEQAVLIWNNGSRSLTVCGPRFAERAPRAVVEMYPCGA